MLSFVLSTVLDADSTLYFDLKRKSHWSALDSEDTYLHDLAGLLRGAQDRGEGTP